MPEGIIYQSIFGSKEESYGISPKGKLLHLFNLTMTIAVNLIEKGFSKRVINYFIY